MAKNVPSLKIMIWNIANTHRDNKISPLCDRLDSIIKVVLTINPDILVLLEAGRASKSLLTGDGYSWTQMAGKIEMLTGLIYEGVWRSTPELTASGKAVFIRYKKPIISVKIEQLSVGSHSDRVCGSVLKLRLHPIGTTVDESHCCRVGVVHFPMALEKRMDHAKWLVDHEDQFDLLVGDMNTFPENGGPELLAIMAAAGFVEQLPLDTYFTFKGFNHDVITIPNEDLKYHQHSQIISTDGTNTSLIPASWLDHVLSKRPVTASTYPVDDNSSDHFPIIFNIDL